MRKILVTLVLFNLLSSFTPTFAISKEGEAKKILDKTAAHISKAGGISLSFTATSLVGKTSQGSTSGTMDIMGKKFIMRTPDIQTWFDGKTQWTLQTGDSEVSMSEPSGAELQAINPYAFLEIYKHGFTYKMKKDILSNGKEGYKIYLTADNSKQEIREMFLEIDLRYNPVRVSMRQGKNQWARIVVNTFKTGQKFNSQHFTFPKKQYPNIEIIDLR